MYMYKVTWATNVTVGKNLTTGQVHTFMITVTVTPLGKIYCIVELIYRRMKDQRYKRVLLGSVPVSQWHSLLAARLQQ